LKPTVAAAECAGTEAGMRALYAALLVTLVGLPAAGQKPAPPQKPVAQKSAPKLVGSYKDNVDKLMLFELRAQQYADRLAIAADKGEGMAMVDYSMRNCSTSLHGGELLLAGLAAAGTPAQKKNLDLVMQHHQLAQKAFDDLRAETKREYPSRANVLRLAYKISDEAMLAQGKKPPKHPIIKSEPATPAK
jgi:hypothetical protein